MMNRSVILFLGSGISYDSGLPTVRGITDSLFDGEWSARPGDGFCPGSSGGVASAPWVPKLREFLRVLSSHADRYATRRRQSPATYEDLYFLCQQIRDEETSEIDNPAIQPFCDLIRNEIGPLCQRFEPPNQEIEVNLGEFARKSCQFIECVVENSLATCVSPKGLGLVGQLAHEPGVKLTITTLNHDLLVERSLETQAIPYADGYDQPAPDLCWFNPALFEARDSKVKLLKLHGSINWGWWSSKNQQGWAKRQLGTKPPYRDLSGDVLTRYPDSVCLIGTYNKLPSYNYGALAHLHTKFFLLLQEHANIVMSGYGWNDHSINGRLLEWLYGRSDRKIVLLHERPEELKSSKSAMWHRYDKLVQSGKLIALRKWLSGTQLDEIRRYI
jgi:hypothetical protein